jgi:Protein of unknown function (DUF2891)
MIFARNILVAVPLLSRTQAPAPNEKVPIKLEPTRMGRWSSPDFPPACSDLHLNLDTKFADLLVSKARQFYLGDKDCPLAYEPSGEDFLSPCLGEADLMRRVLPGPEFAGWLRAFLPQIAPAKKGTWLQPVVSPDPSDPKLAHLDGLNLSRAWMLEGIAAALPKGDKRLPMIMVAAEEHRRAGLAAVTGKHYEGGHWLGSFALYLVTRRGIPQK